MPVELMKFKGLDTTLNQRAVVNTIYFLYLLKQIDGTPILGFYSNTFVANNVALMLIFPDGTTNTINTPADL